MKPLDEKTLGELLSDPHWPRRLHAGEPAETISERGEQVLRSLAKKHGEDPDVVLELVRKNDPLARTVLKVLGIQPFHKKRVGRRADTDRSFREYDVVAALRVEGLKGDELWETARTRLGTEKSVESLQKSVNRVQKRYAIPLAFALHPPKRTKRK